MNDYIPSVDEFVAMRIAMCERLHVEQLDWSWYAPAALPLCSLQNKLLVPRFRRTLHE